MRRVLMALGLGLAAAPALAVPPQVQQALSATKPGGMLAAGQIVTLLEAGHLWCFAPEGRTCGWWDRAFEVEGDVVRLVVEYPWDGETLLRHNERLDVVAPRSLCHLHLPRAEDIELLSPDGTPLPPPRREEARTGLLDWIKRYPRAEFCLDYALVAVSPGEATVTVHQRLFEDGVEQPHRAADVVIHFDAGAAGELSLRF